MFSLPGRLTSSPALQRPGAILNYVSDICTELCDAIQTNVTKVYEGLNSPARQKQPASTSCEQNPKPKSEYIFHFLLFIRLRISHFLDLLLFFHEDDFFLSLGVCSSLCLQHYGLGSNWMQF